MSQSSAPAPIRRRPPGLTALACALCLAAPALQAQSGPPMSAEAFDNYTRGQTFYYGTGLEPYGAEEYLDNRRVRWSFLDGLCRDGIWYEQGEAICFVYEDNPDPQCWTFYETGRGIVARFENDPGLTTLYEIRKSPEPMMCLGPEIGV